MSPPRDVIVIGAGANGLAAATLLARAGRRVLVLERRGTPGGLAAGGEFHPGFRSPGLLHDSTRVGAAVVKELGLERHGLRMRPSRPSVLALGDGGGGLRIEGDPEKAAREISALSARDAVRWPEFHAFIGRIRGVIASFLTSQPLDIVDVESAGPIDLVRRALKVRGLGRKDMLELLRLPPMSVSDWLGEWFESDLLKAAVALDAVAGNWMGPRSPGSNANLLIREALAGPGVEGNGPALVESLVRAAQAEGAEIRTSAPVTRILADAGGARGVELEGGEEIRSACVAASCDPRRVFIDLLPPGVVGTRLAQRIGAFRMRGTTGQVLLALDGVPAYASREGERVEYARTGARLDDIERAFDPIKYRRVPAEPVLEIHVPAGSPPPPARPGGAVMSILVHFLPLEPDGGWTDEARGRLGDAVVDRVEALAPGTRSMILDRKVLAPPDIEAEYGVTGGHIHHGENGLDQILVRPVPECQRYATPLEGLFLCGMGSHPGGGLTCLPGTLAARAILDAPRG